MKVHGKELSTNEKKKVSLEFYSERDHAGRNHKNEQAFHSGWWERKRETQRLGYSPCLWCSRPPAEKENRHKANVSVLIEHFPPRRLSVGKDEEAVCKLGLVPIPTNLTNPLLDCLIFFLSRRELRRIYKGGLTWNKTGNEPLANDFLKSGKFHYHFQLREQLPCF